MLVGGGHASMRPAAMLCTAETVMAIGNRTFVPTGSDVVELASEAIYCASCHDGAIARFVRVGSSEKNLESSTGSSVTSHGTGASHPVDVSYPDGDPDFVSRAQLDPRISLPGGNVTCTSCHPEEGNDDPVFQNRQSRLCLSCHVK
jgi:predicted CXXCH cytochrome family protein